MPKMLRVRERQTFLRSIEAGRLRDAARRFREQVRQRVRIATNILGP